MEREIFEGSCLCGAVRFELTAPPTEVIRCHCRMCQKAHGASYVPFARFEHEAFHVLAGAESIATYRSSDVARRTFCRECGSSLQFIRDEAPTFGLAIAALDTPIHHEPIREFHEESRVHW